MSFPDAEFLTSAVQPDQYPRHRRKEIALAGRSNVGKSSFVNAIANRKGLAYVSKQPGRTQTINFIALDEALCLVDLPGYGYAKVPERIRASWGAIIEGYLSGREQLVAVCLLVDGRHGPTRDDLTMVEWLAHAPYECFAIATKWDKVARGVRIRRLKEIAEALGMEVVPFSAHSGEGKDEVIKRLRRFV